MDISRQNIKVRGYLYTRHGMKDGKPYNYYSVQLVYTDQEGKNHTETHSIGKITSRAKANDERDKLVSAKREELNSYECLNNDGRIIFIDSLISWLKSKKGKIEDNSYDGYVTRSKAIIRYFEMLAEDRGVDAIYLDEIKPVDILGFYEYELKSGKINNKTGEVRGLSRETVCSYSLLLHNYYKYMVMVGIVSSNICDAVSVPREKVDNTKTNNYLNMNQLKEFMGVANIFEDKRIIPIVKICIIYGCRRSEVLGIKWDAVDFEHGVVEIKGTVVRGNKQIYYKNNTKSKSSHRVYPMTKHIRDELMKMKQFQVKEGYYKPDGFVFYDKNKDKPYRPDYVSKFFKKIVQECESIPDDYHFHDMRKTCATLLLECGGWDISDIQMWIGHKGAVDKSSKLLFDHYLTVTMGWKRKKVPSLEKIYKDVF